MNDDIHHLLLYAYVEDIAQRRGPHRDAHLAHIGAHREAGRLVMGGALGDPPQGAAFVFRDTDPAEIERFVAEDPYQRAGLITRHRILRWNLV